MKIVSPRVACPQCELRELCMPSGLSAAELERIGGLVAGRRQVRRGAALFRSGEPFKFLYAIRSGFFKTCVGAGNGREQVCGFSITGDFMGLDGISLDRHTCDAIALEDSQVCLIPFDSVSELSRRIRPLQHHLNRIISREIVREHAVMLLLGSGRAEQRVAAFLLDLVQRLHSRGFSKSELVLRMTREEIGNHLGLKLETVSRAFSRFAAEGWIDVRHRHLSIHDEPALRRIADARHPAPA